uniref:hypothetical protein n=1 Tax=Simonsiella muelleri TaxID=72 RepID=UPI0023F46263
SPLKYAYCVGLKSRLVFAKMVNKIKLSILRTQVLNLKRVKMAIFITRTFATYYFQKTKIQIYQLDKIFIFEDFT